jgi:HSP20 family protein
MKSGRPGTEETPRRELQRQGSPPASPEVDIYEGPDELLLIADVPGVSGDGLTVSLSEAELTIEAKRADRGEPEGEVIVAESSFADFRRSFVLPRGVSSEGIWAEVANGVLRVHLPKAAEPKPRSILVKAR